MVQKEFSAELQFKNPAEPHSNEIKTCRTSKINAEGFSKTLEAFLSSNSGILARTLEPSEGQPHGVQQEPCHGP